VILSKGAEEMETVITVDVMRRAGVRTGAAVASSLHVQPCVQITRPAGSKHSWLLDQSDTAIYDGTQIHYCLRV